jgi:hypothetical protein
VNLDQIISRASYLSVHGNATHVHELADMIVALAKTMKQMQKNPLEIRCGSHLPGPWEENNVRHLEDG